MIGSFNFNNIESSAYNLVCKSVKRPLLPAVKTKRIELAGISGIYDFDSEGNEYAMRQITMKIQYIGNDFEELRTRARDLALWLGVSSFCPLILNDEDDKYYLAKVTNEIDLDTLYESGSADIVFDCQPFALSVEDVDHTFNVTGHTTEVISNPGNRVINFRSPPGSIFQVKMVGSWTTISVTVNGRYLTFNTAASSKTLIFDNIEMECTLDAVNNFNLLGGNTTTFLHVLPGNNSFEINGTGLNVDVTVKFTPLWL
jgi:predicted phage tail component-like protein